MLHTPSILLGSSVPLSCNSEIHSFPVEHTITKLRCSSKNVSLLSVVVQQYHEMTGWDHNKLKNMYCNFSVLNELRSCNIRSKPSFTIYNFKILLSLRYVLGSESVRQKHLNETIYIWTSRIFPYYILITSRWRLGKVHQGINHGLYDTFSILLKSLDTPQHSG